MIDMLTPPTTTATTNLSWVDLFLAQIRAGETIGQASAAAGVTRSWAYICRAENPAFRAAWADAVAEARHRLDWRPVFLDHLRQGRTIVDACARAGVTHRTAYCARRQDMEFARAWDALRPAEQPV